MMKHFLQSSSIANLLSPKSVSSLSLRLSSVQHHFQASSMSTLYKHQSSLPKLPVPSLSETLERYYQSCLPHFENESEVKNTRKAISDFANSPFSQELQSRLLKRAETTTSSWLYDWWNDYAYMSYRDPVVINVSYFFVFQDDKLNLAPAARAATLTKGALKFRQLVLDETLEPESTRSGPLCSEQYRFLFNTCRIPQKPSDTTRVVSPSENNFIIAIRKNKFFKIDTHDSNGKEYSASDLKVQFEKVIQLAGEQKDTPVGLLTAENRDVWTDARNELIAVSPINKTSLDTIERAAFVVCLDDTSPVTREEASRACWHGDGRNRFFDKAAQFIVFENGKAGFLGEHSMMDATPTSRLCDYVLTNLDKKAIDLGASSPSGSLPAPTKLDFRLTPQLETKIESAGSSLDEAIRKHDVKVVVCEAYGKSLVKKLGVSPDSYAQMAIQLAYFKLYGKLPAMYESAQTRKFAYGRTETCRSVTTASLEWVKAMSNPHLSTKEKGELGRKAIASQVAYMANAVEGKGVDRHLLGLRLLIKPNETKPSLFTDPLFSRTCHWKLSTSQITSEYYDGYGWGEVVPDGYGIAYMIKDNSFHFNVCSLFLRNHHFETYLHEAISEMRQVFEATIPAPRSKL